MSCYTDKLTSTKKSTLPAEEQRILMNAVAQRNWDAYEQVVVFFSGGKDSVACVLQLLELGCPKSKMELWHHDIDGKEGRPLMDWTITPAYCEAFAQEMGLTLRHSWKVGGFEREMCRDNEPTAPTKYELPNGTVGQTGGKGKGGTRMKFPQVAADLKVRWCSAYLKIDVGATALRKDPRFQTGGRYLVVTGERRDESGPRSRYMEFEAHRASTKSRNIHHWRAVIDMGEQEVWDLMAKYQVEPHPCYKLGFGRCSCSMCIFGNCNQWRTAQDIYPDQFDDVATYEDLFGVTIHRTQSVTERVSQGTSYLTRPLTVEQHRTLEIARGHEYTGQIKNSDWTLPSGAFKGDCGPT